MSNTHSNPNQKRGNIEIMKKPLKIEEANLEVLLSLKQEMENELETLQDHIGKVETEIYYRNNPELRSDKEKTQ